MPKGRIMKALSGFYYVESNGIVYQCRGRGIFRQRKVTPLVGDFVDFEISGNNEGYIHVIEDRKNELLRPPIANVDQTIIVASLLEPDLSLNLLDKFLVMVEAKKIRPLLFFTKKDLLTDDEIENWMNKLYYYQKIGYSVNFLSTKEEDLDIKLAEYLSNKVSVFAGQSGVGKSSLLNSLIPGLELGTNEISESLGRGKHTTRHVELISYRNGWIADTPGFSALDFQQLDLEDLPMCYPDFVELSEKCKFRGCMHLKEPKCAVKEAVNNGDVLTERYDNYLQFVEEIKQRKPRY